MSYSSKVQIVAFFSLLRFCYLRTKRLMTLCRFEAVHWETDFISQYPSFSHSLDKQGGHW